ncbi:hypothetical protein BGZ76_001453 [Entomortierella beljakovae]|nr:hypothetical protein BGZ76_001453 [Entomortierella beljakovae]
MEYAKISNLSTSLPHFHESFPSPSYKSNEYTRSNSPSCNTYITPLSASSLQAYNNMNSSVMNKRKANDFDIAYQNENMNDYQGNKRLMIDHPVRLQFSGSRQRQESGCSVSSSSSWSSSASFSTVCSSVTVPDLSSSSPNRSLASSRSPSPSESVHNGDVYNPLWHLCDAIDLSEKQEAPINKANIRTESKSSHALKSNKRDEGLQIVFLDPNWLEEHMAKSKKIVALKKQQQYSS